MEKEKTISIILVNYNGKQYNTACIESILQNKGKYEKHILVVDNASGDDSVEILQKQYETDSVDGNAAQIELILLDDNYGFAAANNVGIKRAKELHSDYVLLLNNDTEIAPDMLQSLTECAARHPDGMIVPKIYYSDDRKRIWSAGGSISPVIKKVRHDGLNQIDEGQFEKEREIQFATGCCLFLPMKVIEKAGELDESFFLYYEDTEYSFRLHKLGISIYYCPKAYLYHKVGASSQGEESPLCAYYISRNWLICNRKHLGKAYPIFCLYYAVNRLACCLLWILQGKKELAFAAVRGIRDYGKGKCGKAGDLG